MYCNLNIMSSAYCLQLLQQLLPYGTLQLQFLTNSQESDSQWRLKNNNYKFSKSLIKVMRIHLEQVPTYKTMIYFWYMERTKTLNGVIAYQGKCCMNIQEDKTRYMFQQLHTWGLYILSLKKPQTSKSIFCSENILYFILFEYTPSGRHQRVFPLAEFGLWLWNRCTIRKCLQYKHFYDIYGWNSEIPLNQFRMLLWA